MEACTPLQLLRKPKILNMSIFDWVTSLLAAALVGMYFKLHTVPQWIFFLVGWILFGVAAHAAFGVNTMFGYYLGINPPPRREECV